MKFIAALITLLALGATGAQASTVIDLTGNGKWSPTYSFSKDNINLTVSPGEGYGGHVYRDRYSYLYQQRHHGLGIYTPGNGQSKEIDGGNANEIMQFLFDKAVQLVSVTFSKVDRNDDFDFYFDAGNGLTKKSGDVDIPGSDEFVFSNLWTGTLFGFGADHYSDNFTIKKIEVATVTAIPLPAALPLYGTGLALVGYFGWRRHRRTVAHATRA